MEFAGVLEQGEGVGSITCQAYKQFPNGCQVMIEWVNAKITVLSQNLFDF